MTTLSIKASSGNLETYEALLLQLPENVSAGSVDFLELGFGDVTQVFPSAFCLVATYLGRVRDKSKRLLVSRKFGANPSSAKLERVMDSFGFIPAVTDQKGQPHREGSGVVPLIPILPGTTAESVASQVLDAVLETAQPTRDAKETLFVLIAELVDNILRHGQIESPAFLCGQLAPQKRKLELCLADPGIGIRASFESGKDGEAIRKIRAGQSALNLALEPGRTSKGAGHTGLGLHLARAASELNRGIFRLTSGDETVLVSREGLKHRSHARWHGTVVNLLYNLDKLGSLAEVYRPLPMESEERRYVTGAEPHGLPLTTFTLKDDAPYVGSRERAARLRGSIQEALRAERGAVVDLEGVLAMTPAFADECFGDLLSALGEDSFRASVGFKGAADPTRLLLEVVLHARASGLGKPKPAAGAASKPVVTPPTASAGGEGGETGVEPGGGSDADPS